MRDGMSKLAAVIFSKNRAMQLDALLSSMWSKTKCFDQVNVLYAVTSDKFAHSYAVLQDEWRSVVLISQIDFLSQLKGMLSGLDESGFGEVCFLCDDDVFYREAGTPEFSFGQRKYSFRLGQNITKCFNVPGDPLADFGYPFSLDGEVYRIADVLHWLGYPIVSHVATPNDLEFAVNELLRGSATVFGCADISSLVGVPHNKVSTGGGAPHMGGSAEQLNEMYLEGWRIDVDATFEGQHVDSVHFPVEYKFKQKVSTAVLDQSDPDLLNDGAVWNRPTFSICHPTARLPLGWVAAYEQAMENADNPESVEYILCVDEKDWRGEMPVAMLPFPPLRERPRVVVNEGRCDSVTATNCAVAASTGSIIINGQDDVFFPPHWDTELLKVVSGHYQVTHEAYQGWSEATFGKREFFIHVSSGSPSDATLFAPQIYSRARYEKQGWAFYPEYESMYADNDVTELAYRDGIVIEAPHLLFEQRHPAFGKSMWDAIYERENAQGKYIRGKELLDRRRRALGFGPQDIPNSAPAVPPAIMVCLPGESFHHTWVAAWSTLQETFAKSNVSLFPVFGYCSNVYTMRGMFTQEIAKCPVQPKYVLWLDDDNIVTPAQLQMLFEDLEAHPELSGVGGWCWTQFDGIRDGHRMSCGTLDESGRTVPFTMRDIESATGLLGIDYSGFPCFLFRAEAMTAMGPEAFQPLLAPDIDCGYYGEDVGWFVRAGIDLHDLRVYSFGELPTVTDRKYKFAVDARVKVQHLKLSDAAPDTAAVPVPVSV